MKNKKRNELNFRKVILLLILFALIIAIIFNIRQKSSNDYITSSIWINRDSSKYKVIKQDHNSNYSGIGQEQVTGKDGYFTTFTTENGNKKIYKEYKQNGNSSWSNKKYWDSTMSESGCGITAMSIILSGYNKNYTPDDLRKKYYPSLRGDKISYELSHTFGISNSDFYYDSSHLSDKYIEKHLQSNRPILICMWSKSGDNRWTTSSHYMVLLATDGHGMVYVSNPNGLENSSKSSGWYDIDEVLPYIAKALFID
ncbi:MAG: C39 family peptidase [Clostridia bacterium]|nr:C39 family peptidase [Clostridia bacterium]